MLGQPGLAPVGVGSRVLQTWCNELRAVLGYEWAKGCTPSEIHTKLVDVYGDSVCLCKW
jgi:hypothetical protein